MSLRSRRERRRERRVDLSQELLATERMKRLEREARRQERNSGGAQADPVRRNPFTAAKQRLREALERRCRLKGSSSRARAFYKRMRAAERCPVDGPCGHCEDAGPHVCLIGRLQGEGLGTAKAFERAFGQVATRQLPFGLARLNDEIAGRRLLARLCMIHRRAIELLLQERLANQSSMPAGETEVGGLP